VQDNSDLLHFHDWTPQLPSIFGMCQYNYSESPVKIGALSTI